jgi:tetratricopeptide (TPR) repeat protein
MTTASDSTNAHLLHAFLSHLTAGRKLEANAVLREALRVAPFTGAPYALLLGDLLARNDQYGEAVPLYQQAICLNPADPTAYFYLGVALHALREEDESDRVWDELAARFPGHAMSHYQRALRALRTNDFAEAKTELQSAVVLFGDDNPLREGGIKTLSAIELELSRQKS